jgi:hypothetical protein
MEKWKPLNMSLRSSVIEHALRLEQAATNIVRSVLRLSGKDTKTLGNQSSAISFKTKIDILFDLEDIGKEEYSNLIKMMEIRNQFAHNPYATSFAKFAEINTDISNYLTKKFPNDVPEDQCELKLATSYMDLYKISIGRLLSLELEYRAGVEEEMKRYLNDQVIENIDNIWDSVYKKYIEGKAESKAGIINVDAFEDYKIKHLYYDFRIAMTDFFIQKLNELDEKEKRKEVFQRKVELIKLIKKQEQKNKKDET